MTEKCRKSVGSLTRKHSLMNQAELELDAHPHRITLNPMLKGSIFTFFARSVVPSVLCACLVSYQGPVGLDRLCHGFKKIAIYLWLAVDFVDGRELVVAACQQATMGCHRGSWRHRHRQENRRPVLCTPPRGVGRDLVRRVAAVVEGRAVRFNFLPGRLDKRGGLVKRELL